jgi:2-polyprenyl-6-methoxyphenol hydroxylase-like FAD-dependent oxidoreductase
MGGTQTPGSSPARRNPDGSGHDRGTLVVDGGPAALVAAGFLDQAGLDPVLAAGPTWRGPAAVTLWRPGLELLGRIGLRRPVEAAGRPVTELRCRGSTGHRTAPSPAGTPVVIRRARLEALLADRLCDRLRTTDREVVAVRSGAAGVRVTFEDEVTEPFDAVVAADRRLVPGDGPTDAAEPVHWWSFDWPESVSGPGRATEAWGDSAVALTTPAGGSRRALLVAPDGPRATPLSPARLAERFGDIDRTVADALAALDGSELRYGRADPAAPASLCVEGVALVGPAARAPLPGDCLGPALAVEDGWVLADALAFGPGPVDDALGAYADRRRRRMAELAAATSDDGLVERAPAGVSGPLRELCARRTVALGHLFDAAPDGLGRGIPRRL